MSAHIRVPLGRRQMELLRSIRDHGAVIEVVRTQKDVVVFESLERRGLVRWARRERSASLHSLPFDATYLTDAGREAVGK